MGKYDDILAGINASSATVRAPTKTAGAGAPGRYDDILASLNTPGGVAEKPAEDLPQERSAFQRFGGALPVAGSVVGGILGTGAGAVTGPGAIAFTVGGAGLGAATGEAARQHLGRILGEDVPMSGGEAAKDIGIEAALGAGGELVGLGAARLAKPVLKVLKESSGRRALGFTKRFLSKEPGQLAEKNKVVQTMLDEGVLRPFSGTEKTLERALSLGKRSGRTIGAANRLLERTGKGAVKPRELVSEIESQLGPKFGGEKKFIFNERPGQKLPLFEQVTTPTGAYGKTRRIVNEAKDTVKAHGGVGFSSPEEIGFKSLQKLKEKLAKIGKFIPGNVDERQRVFQRATGIVRKAQDEAVERVAPPGIAKRYTRAKDVYGDTEKAIAGLTNRLSSEEGNLQLGLLDTVLAAGGLASGNIAGALATIGGKKALDRAGSGTIASIANSLSKSSLPRETANVVFQNIISALISALGRDK